MSNLSLDSDQPNNFHMVMIDLGLMKHIGEPYDIGQFYYTHPTYNVNKFKRIPVVP